MNAIRRFLPAAVRVLLGLIFFVFGLNGFLNFLPVPPHPGPGGDFLGALLATGYMFPLIKGTEVVAGALLLSGRFVPLALTLLAPVIINIVAFHAALDPAGVPMTIAILLAELFLAWTYRDSFKPMLRARTQPRLAADSAPEREHVAAST